MKEIPSWHRSSRCGLKSFFSCRQSKEQLAGCIKPPDPHRQRQKKISPCHKKIAAKKAEQTAKVQFSPKRRLCLFFLHSRKTMMCKHCCINNAQCLQGQSTAKQQQPALLSKKLPACDLSFINRMYPKKAIHPCPIPLRKQQKSICTKSQKGCQRNPPPKRKKKAKANPTESP